jgi:hypothetical protein
VSGRSQRGVTWDTATGDKSSRMKAYGGGGKSAKWSESSAAQGDTHYGFSTDTSFICPWAGTIGNSGKAAAEDGRNFDGSCRGPFLQPGSSSGSGDLSDVVWRAGLGRAFIALPLGPAPGKSVIPFHSASVPGRSILQDRRALGPLKFYRHLPGRRRRTNQIPKESFQDA